jgi:hypothetical protein
VSVGLPAWWRRRQKIARAAHSAELVRKASGRSKRRRIRNWSLQGQPTQTGLNLLTLCWDK